jgi:hypothetical protein
LLGITEAPLQGVIENKPSFITELREGLKLVWEIKWLAASIFMASFQLMVIVAAETVLLPVITRREFDTNNVFAISAAAFSLGGAISAIAAVKFKTKSPGLVAISMWSLFAFAPLVLAFPISPNVPRSWPKKDKLSGHHIILTDVSVPEYILGEWEDVTESIFCIDHHTSSEKTWKGHEDISVHCTQFCASVLAWRHFFPEEKEPDWLMQIDRIDRWVDATDDDRAMRELMMPIAHKAVESSCIEALDETLGYTQCYGMRDQYRMMLAQCH